MGVVDVEEWIWSSWRILETVFFISAFILLFNGIMDFVKDQHDVEGTMIMMIVEFQLDENG